MNNTTLDSTSLIPGESCVVAMPPAHEQLATSKEVLHFQICKSSNHTI